LWAKLRKPARALGLTFASYLLVSTPRAGLLHFVRNDKSLVIARSEATKQSSMTAVRFSLKFFKTA
jgi:hypothetical protein